MRKRIGAAGRVIRWGLLSLLLVLALAVLLQNLLSNQAILDQGAEGKSKSPPPLQQEVAATTAWMNVYSPYSLLDGGPLPAGTLVEAYDPQGVPCGEFVVSRDGKYGLMPIYGDDPSTPADEGALPGDTITFWVNGVQATSTPAKLVWTTYGDVQRADLYAASPAQAQRGWFGNVIDRIRGAFSRHTAD